jgi:hypothetical protein
MIAAELTAASDELIRALGLGESDATSIRDTMVERVEWLRQMIAAFRVLGLDDEEIRAFSLEWYNSNVPEVAELAGLTEEQGAHVLRYVMRVLDLALNDPFVPRCAEMAWDVFRRRMDVAASGSLN